MRGAIFTSASVLPILFPIRPWPPQQPEKRLLNEIKWGFPVFFSFAYNDKVPPGHILQLLNLTEKSDNVFAARA